MGWLFLIFAVNIGWHSGQLMSFKRKDVHSAFSAHKYWMGKISYWK